MDRARDITVDGVLAQLQRVCISDDSPGGAGELILASMKADTEAMIRKARDDLRQLSLQRGAADEASSAPPPTHGEAVLRVKATEESALREAAPPPSPSGGAGVLHTASHATSPSLDAAVRLVRAELGAYNWVLLAPGPSGEAVLLDAGNGSVNQMAQTLRDDQVCFGMLRMGFGKGQFRRSKWIFVKFSGERVPALKRGLANAHDASMRQVRSDECYHGWPPQQACQSLGAFDGIMLGAIERDSPGAFDGIILGASNSVRRPVCARRTQVMGAYNVTWELHSRDECTLDAIISKVRV